MPHRLVRRGLLRLGLVLVVLAAYANHFHNDFHFDDAHTVTGNPAIGALRNIPRFFVDPALFSSKPEARTWRPVVSSSLALDYWLGRSLRPFYFHLSTFVWFALQLVLMFFLFHHIMERADPHPSNLWTALAATACYGLHPANAETVNYIIQRADLYNTLGVVASLWWFARYPAKRKYAWYLIPALAADLAKAPALIYPAILLAYVFLVEQEGQPAGKWAAAVRATIPAFAVTVAAAIVTVKMTPAAYNPGAESAAMYRLTQPWVALHYFRTFFVPTGLSADRGWSCVSNPFSAQALAGYAFVAGLIAAAVSGARRRATRPIAFGIFWFLLALLPTALLPLADVTNDHRMFFPFVGLTLAVFWSLRLVLFRKTARFAGGRPWVWGTVAAVAAVLLLGALGTRQRNRVWRTEESLWHDVTVKSPANGRGWTNYAIVLMARHDYPAAIACLERAKVCRPGDPSAEVNLAIASSGVGRDEEARRHFQNALALAPDDEAPDIQYGSWLRKKGRLEEAQARFTAALRKNPLSFAACDRLAQIYRDQGNRRAAEEIVDEGVQLAWNGSARSGAPAAQALRELAAAYCKDGDYDGCLLLARKALELEPGSAEACDSMAVAYLYLERWDEGIQAARQALQLKPNYRDAKDHLAWGLRHKLLT